MAETITNNIFFYLLPFLSAFVLSIVFTPLVLKFARDKGIVDHPGSPRKIHQSPVPLLGGVAIFASFALLTLVFWYLGWLTDDKIGGNEILGLLLAGLILIIGGALDDKFGFKHWKQIWFPLVAAGVVVWLGVGVEYVTNPFVSGTGPFGRSLLYFGPTISLVFSFFWILGMMYTTKLLDGLDGLVTGIGTIGAIIIFVVSLFWDVPLSGTSVLALLLAGSMGGFLIFNFHPAKIFLGEGGALFIGFMLGVLSIISGGKIATALLIMGIPILDVVWVILRRLFWEKKSPFWSDKKHLHFRLLDIGLSQRQAVAILYLLTLVFGVSSLFLQSTLKVLALGLLMLVMLVLATGLVLIYKKGIQ